jgi:hypothetical protein
MIKKIVLTITCLIILNNQTVSSSSLTFGEIAIALNQTLGAQFDYSSKINYSFSYQGNLLLLNYGYVYQTTIGSKAYVGISTYCAPFFPIFMVYEHSSIEDYLTRINTKIQYGRAFSAQQNLLKISFDYMFASVSGGTGLASFSTVGIFVEKNFGKDLPLIGYTFGISLNWSIWDIFIIKDKAHKYFQKYENNAYY